MRICHIYPVVVVLVLVDVLVLELVLVVVVLVDVDVDVVVVVDVDVVDQVLTPSQLFPLYLNQLFFVESQYSSPVCGSDGGDEANLIFPFISENRVPIIFF